MYPGQGGVSPLAGSCGGRRRSESVKPWTPAVTQGHQIPLPRPQCAGRFLCILTSPSQLCFFPFQELGCTVSPWTELLMSQPTANQGGTASFLCA
jgi:hypothetical protein